MKEPAGSAASLVSWSDGATARVESVDSFLAEVARISTTRGVEAGPFASPGALIARRYRLERPLGRGAHGVVWAAHDALARGAVAVKLLPARAGDGAARVRAEIASLRRLRLPGVIQLLDEGVEEGAVFLVMPLVEGAPFPGAARPAPWEALAHPVELLLETLGRVHGAGIVHRDLKPANVLVDARGQPIVLDFGLALGPAFEGDDDAGWIAGTPAYLAPEQLRGGRVDLRADLHAVGAMLYQALSGRLPHAERRIEALLAAKAAPPPPLASVAPGVPAQVARAVDALLATAPDDRPASAEEALERLRGARVGPRGAPRGWSDLGEAAAPLTEEALRALFVASSRLSSVEDDAARVLHERTLGDPLRVRAELDAWVRSGHCRWDGGDPPRLRIDRDAIDGLEARLWVRASPDDPAAFAEESLSLARELARAGRLGNATATLHEAVAALRRAEPWPLALLERALALWVEVAVADGAPQALDRVLHELCRVGPRSALLLGLDELVRAGLAVGAWNERALELGSSIPAFADPALERVRSSIRVAAARRVSIAREERVLGELSADAEAADPVTRAAFSGWLGRLRYRQGRYDEAAELHGRAAEGQPWITVRCAALTSRASALMEAFRFDEAAATIAEALRSARASRHTHGRAQTELIARGIAYRRAEALTPDLAWIEAVADLHLPELTALACLTEAAVAFRCDERALARHLAERGRQAWASVGEQGGGLLLISALSLACADDDADPDLAARLAEEALACPTPGVGVQVLALLAPRLDGAPLRADRARSLAAQVPEARWDLRVDVLSVRESLARIAAAPLSPAGSSR